MLSFIGNLTLLSAAVLVLCCIVLLAVTAHAVDGLAGWILRAGRVTSHWRFGRF